MISRFLSFGIPFVLCNLMAPDQGGPVGGGADISLTYKLVPAGSVAPADMPEPTGNTLEEKHTNLLSAAKDYYKQLGGAMRERDESVASLATVTSERDTLQTEKATLTSDLGSLTSERDGLKTQITGLTTERDQARGRVSLIEAFAKSKGLDLTGIEKSAAVKEVPEGQPKDTDAVIAQYKKLKSPQAKARFRKEHKAEIDAYLAQGSEE